MKTRLIPFAVLACSLAGPASAQSYPSQPIRMVVPFAAGSGTDQVARVLGQAMTAAANVTVVIENKPGANGFIAAQAVASAAPDGYTMLLTTNTTHAANQHLFKHLPYDPVKDYTPVALLRKGYQIMVVRADFPTRNVADFIALARKQPGKLNFGSGSSSSQVAGELFKQMANVELTHVPYKSNPQALNDLMGGQIDVVFVDTSSAITLVQGGKLRALAATSPVRLSMLPDVPTLDQAGLKGYEMSYWTAAYLPRGASKEATATLNKLLIDAVRSPEMAQLMAKTGTEVSIGSPVELAAFQAAESDKWARIIRAANIQPE
ncbi:MAG: ABC transporter substrate-binding protein [Bordetella sp. SCN 67-23]|nr:tripartite tricarboxylate transporter substrate binding protein [Burkholderiales bacterium]ODS65993.1 MAG: ABC transporter substrate-binding protein [Bordetella sp. SCN 67-23]ODU73703.1 MAG: ABC transporter substrate-binding protein [Bordetella sp. SCN 68-11]OJW87914.1 MAG: ABC transporter substrate-binding protein [Burkholderiales bacterium 67-32]